MLIIGEQTPIGMAFTSLFLDYYENTAATAALVHSVIRLNPGARIISSTIRGPLYLNKNTQLGPDVDAGKYVGMNESCFIARATIGAFCAIGARTSINPFNHPTNWLSTNEFQYHPKSFDWVEEYNNFVRLERTPDMFKRVTVGNDVWTGHNVNVMAGVNVGDGAIIAAGRRDEGRAALRNCQRACRRQLSACASPNGQFSGCCW